MDENKKNAIREILVMGLHGVSSVWLVLHGTFISVQATQPETHAFFGTLSEAVAWIAQKC